MRLASTFKPPKVRRGRRLDLGPADPAPAPESYGNVYRPAPIDPLPYSSGRVNVRGYTRKDGTYVRPHTRSAPRR